MVMHDIINYHLFHPLLRVHAPYHPNKSWKDQKN